MPTRAYQRALLSTSGPHIQTVRASISYVQVSWIDTPTVVTRMTSHFARSQLTTDFLLKGKTVDKVKLTLDTANAVTLGAASHVPFNTIGHDSRVAH